MSGSDKSTNESHTSTTLLHRAQQGDEAAWREIAEMYTPLIYFWCRRQDIKSSDIKEILANVLGTVALQIGRFVHNGHAGAFRSWLRTITRHEIADFYRAVGPEGGAVGGTTARERLEQTEEVSEAEAREEITILYHRAWELIRSEFSDRDNEIFARVVEHQEPPRDVAEQLGLARHIVHKVVSRIKHRLREKLCEEPAD